MYVVMRELCDRYVYPVSENKEKNLVLNHATNGREREERDLNPTQIPWNLEQNLESW